MIKLPGQSIIETVIAAALISVAILAAISLSVYSQKQSSYAKYLAEATKYASQAADWLRTERDLVGWGTLADKVTSDGSPATYCLNNLPVSPSDFTSLTPGSCASGSYIPQTTFIRQITADTGSQASGVIKLTITLSWQDSALHTTSQEMELTKW